MHGHHVPGSSWKSGCVSKGDGLGASRQCVGGPVQAFVLPSAGRWGLATEKVTGVKYLLYSFYFVSYDIDMIMCSVQIAVALCTSVGETSENPNTKFDVKGHSLSVLSSVKKLLLNEELCDVVLCVGKLELPAHRVILAANSPYFEAMFTGPLRESSQERITLPDVDEKAAAALVEFMYSSQITITEENAEACASVAARWQLDDVTKACGEFLSRQLDVDNCLEWLSFAEAHGCNNLADAAFKFATEHFSDVCASHSFLTVPSSVLVSLLKCDDLCVQTEEEILDYLLKWYEFDVSDRKEQIVTLLPFVKLPQIAWERVKEKLESHSLLSNPECLTMMINARNYQLYPEVVADYNLDDTQYLPRRSIGRRDLIYVVGGEVYPARSTVASVEEFNPLTDQWQEKAPMPSPRRGVGICFLNGLLYAVGGSDGSMALRLVESYNPQTDLWARVEDLQEERSSVGAAVIEGQLYAVGGYDGVSSCLQSVERYNPQNKEWSMVAPMNTTRSMMSIAVSGQFMYAIGGYDGSADLSSCEAYNADSNQWSFIATLNIPRCIPGVCIIGQVLYAVGGCDRSQSLNSAEVYQPDTDSWTMVASMHKPRSGLGVAAVRNKLYAIGGYTGNDYCRSVECYDPQTNKWHPMSRMKVGRRRFGCCS